MKLTSLSWNVQTERFLTDSTARNVGRYYSVVKEPLKAAFRRERELSAADIDRFQAIVGQTKPGAPLRT